MYKIYFDGGSRGNPGISGSGFVIFDENNHVVKSGSKYLGVNTNNYAEYTGLLLALQNIENKNKPIEIYGDSKLVICQINGEWKVKALNLKPLYDECMSILKNMNFKAIHILRNLNSEADKLANEAMDNK